MVVFIVLATMVMDPAYSQQLESMAWQTAHRTYLSDNLRGYSETKGAFRTIYIENDKCFMTFVFSTGSMSDPTEVQSVSMRLV